MNDPVDEGGGPAGVVEGFEAPNKPLLPLFDTLGRRRKFHVQSQTGRGGLLLAVGSFEIAASNLALRCVRTVGDGPFVVLDSQVALVVEVAGFASRDQRAALEFRAGAGGECGLLVGLG